MQTNASDTFKKEFETAREYLAVSGADFVLAELDARDEVITLVETSGLGKHDVEFRSDTGTIAWNPYAAVVTTDGGSQSPATQLSHETDHALDWLKDPAAHAARKRQHDAPFTNAEERRVIRGSEKEVTRLKGEDAREDHYGNLVRVPSARDRPERPE